MEKNINSDSVIIDEVITSPLTILNALDNCFNSMPGTLKELVIRNNVPIEHYLENASPDKPIFDPVEKNEVKAIINGLKK